MILETLIFRSIWAFAWIRPLDLFLVIWKQKKVVKVEKIYEDSLDSIPSPSPSVKIQIIGGKV